jgi:hypothetical protein
MSKMRCFCIFGMAFIALIYGIALNAQTGDPAAIQLKLNTQFKLTRTTADRSDIVTAGDVVTILKPGLVMYATYAPLPPSNTFKNGRIGQGWGGFGKDLIIGMAAPGGATAADYPHRQFVAGEKCWVTEVTAQNDGVLFKLYSDPYDDIRYYANLKIPFPNKKSIPSVDAALQLVAEVLTVVPQDDQGGQQAQSVQTDQGAQPAGFSGQYFLKNTGAHLTLSPNGSFVLITVEGRQSPGQFTVNGDTLTLTYSATGRSAVFKIQEDKLITNRGLAWVREGEEPAPPPVPEVAEEPTPVPAPGPMPDIAPPPPPADAPPPTIALRQTKDEVIAIMGPPTRIARQGVKDIFYYKEMKVTFTNGKVSNVE